MFLVRRILALISRQWLEYRLPMPGNEANRTGELVMIFSFTVMKFCSLQIRFWYELNPYIYITLWLRLKLALNRDYLKKSTGGF